MLDQQTPTTAAGATSQAGREVMRVGAQMIQVGDCAAVLRTLPAGSVDVVVTSPPYNIGLRYNAYDDGGQREAYLAWMAKIGRLIARVLKEDGSFFLNVGGTNADPWIPQDIASGMRGLFTLQNSIIWVKSLSIEERSFGHFKPVNSRRYLNHTHESIFHFTPRGATPLDRLAVGVPFQDKSNIARWGHKADRRCAGNVWFIPYETIRSKEQRDRHPSPFPVELPERCIRLHGKAGAMVLDPFLGIGSTLIASERLGCTGIGSEIDPVYAQAAARRLAASVAMAR